VVYGLKLLCTFDLQKQLIMIYQIVKRDEHK